MNAAVKMRRPPLRLHPTALLREVNLRFPKCLVELGYTAIGGKTGFEAYRSFLGALMTPCYVVADRDYLTLVGSSEVRKLFVADPGRAWEALTDKKSKDATTLVAELGRAVKTSDMNQLQRFWEYFVGRRVKLKDPLSAAERTAVESDQARLARDGLLLLKEGEIEDYLPAGVSGVQSVVELTTDPNWINRVESESRRIELGHVVCRIPGVSTKDATQLEEELRQRRVAFPEPLSERPRDKT